MFLPPSETIYQIAAVICDSFRERELILRRAGVTTH